MMVKDCREYRQMSFEVRKAQDGEEKDYKVSGYASTYEPYMLFKDSDGTEYVENIIEGAFDDCDMSDVIFLYNHEGMVYARQKNGTLKVEVDGKGLYTEADLGTTEQSRQMFEQIDSGLIDQMSFAFTVAEDEYKWNTDYSVCTRVIKRIDKVYDVSAVSIPANPDTDISAISARKAFNGVIEARTAERLEHEKQLALAKAKFAFSMIGGK